MKKVFIAAFISICLIPLIFMVFFPDAETNYENRPLSRFPDKLSSDFPEEFQDYFSDNFGLRATFVSLNSLLSYTLLNDSLNNSVIVGKDGWLFFDETTDDHLRTNTFTDSELHRFYRNLKLMDEYLSSKNIKFYFMAAPNKNSIYGEHMPERYKKPDPMSNLELISMYLDKMDFPQIDLHTLLNRRKSAAQLYHKKDTHWNNFGAYTAYTAVMDHLKLPYADISDLTHITRKDFFGDLQKMLTPAIKIYDDQVYLDLETTYSYRSVFRTFDDMIIETHNGHSQKTLVMFRDSFANALIPYISNSVRNVTYFRHFPYNYILIEPYSPDFVIVEIAERNLSDILMNPPVFPSLPQPVAEIKNDLHANSKTVYDISYQHGLMSVGGSVPEKDIYEIFVRLDDGSKTIIYEAFTYNSAEDDHVHFKVLIANTDLDPEKISADILYRIDAD